MTVSAVSLVLVCSAGPATAEEPLSAEVTELPAALVDDLARAEQHTLTDLTEGEGVPLAAFVVTPDGPEIVTLDADRRADATAAVRLLEQQPSVEAAAVSSVVRATGGAYAQYGNDAVGAEPARSEVSAATLHGVVVAVLDTGVAAHSELAASLVAGQNFTDPDAPLDTTDRQGHGTHVAGTIGADLASFVEGVAAGVRIMPVKVLGDDGSGYTDWAAEGIVWAADNGADVINMSLGGPGDDPVQAEAITYARSKGVTVIAAAGNDNVSTPFYPAASPGVIGVAAVDQYRDRASFSNYGSYVDVAAPGVSILSTDFTGNGYSYKSGTSMAAPHVAGVVALMEAAAPALTPDQVEQALTASSADLGAPGRDDLFGHGQVDAVRAVRSAKALAAPPTPAVRAPSAPRLGTSAAVPGGVRVSWSPPVDDGGAPVTTYRVTAFRGAIQVRSVVVTAPTRTVTVKGLRNGTAYRLGVAAANSAGHGPASALLTATPRTKPAAPRISSTAVRKKAVAVRWARPANTGGAPVTGYVVRVYSAGRLLKAVDTKATTTRVTVPGLSKSRSYTFRVLAKNAAGVGTASAPSKAVRPR
jgi:subtilisin family serine protease